MAHLRRCMQPKRCVKDMQTERLAPDDHGINRAAHLLRAGQLVAFPTETVYGLGGDARDDLAVARIFQAKGRPRFNPLIVHVAALGQAETYASFSPLARDMAARFWPGPLTLVLPLRADAGLSSLVTADLSSVAIRVPAHPVARALLAAFGGPLAAPSANPSGRISPTCSDHVASGLDGLIAGIVDGGPCAVGVESTIVSMLDDGPRLLRHGGLVQEEIEKALGQPLQGPSGSAQAPILAPGMLASHYAPTAALRMGATGAQAGEVMIGFGPIAGDLTLSASGDLLEAAAALFSTLRRADDLALARSATGIAVAPIPNHGLGRAINDRLSRAAAPRP
ncbi:MAG: L-threonylcarbamoyladenylate synthase [Cypionkella sp.]|nr:L-threonylcarbamoyladenylate synthase [Cypionkella sp.]